MRNLFGTALAAAVFLVLVGCGGDESAGGGKASGPSFEATLAGAKESAARAALLQYAGPRKERAGAEAARLGAPKAPTGEVAPPNGESPRGQIQPPEASVTTEEPSPELIKAQVVLARWTALIKDLMGPNASRCFTIKECKAGEVRGKEANSRLVVALSGAYAGMAAGDLTFDLRWRRVERPGEYKGDPRVNWELGDVLEVSGDK